MTDFDKRRKKKKKVKNGKIGLFAPRDYDENGNLDMEISYGKNGSMHFLCACQIQFDTGTVCVYRTSRHFFCEDRQKHFLKACSALNFDDFVINYNLEDFKPKKPRTARKRRKKRNPAKNAADGKGENPNES